MDGDKRELIKALKLAIKALNDQARVFAFDAYLVDKLGVTDPTAVRAKERNDELDGAAEKLKALIEALDKGADFDAALREQRAKGA